MSEASELRQQPGVQREYGTDQITVRWEPSLCIHSANCLRAAPEVFDVDARPWVRLENASADQIVQAIMTCPTGALAFERTDGGPQESYTETTISPRINGPLVLRGEFQILDATGQAVRRTRVALCRCGASGNKPYCDLSHRRIDFHSV